MSRPDDVSEHRFRVLTGRARAARDTARTLQYRAARACRQSGRGRARAGRRHRAGDPPSAHGA